MKLYNFLINANCNQVFHIYVTNAYDQNIPVAHGTRKEIFNEDIYAEGIDHLMDKVDSWYVCKSCDIVILLRDKNSKKRCEKLYNKEYVKKWDNLRPETRPWLHSCELER